MSSIYSRDSRSPVPKNTTVSKVMSANRAKNTKPEILLRKRLFSENLRGYRLHFKQIPGSPDIVFTKKKIAVFVNGCYWHRCPICNLPLPKNNTAFWEDKFDSNKRRDSRKIEDLEKLGYNVITVWECEIKNNLSLVIERIRSSLSM